MPFKDKDIAKQYQKEYHAKWYQKNKEKRNQQIKEYAKTKPEEWRKNIGRKHHLNSRYQLTPEEYQVKLKEQNYKCGICDKDVVNNIRGGNIIALSVDHNHNTGKIRKLLCHSCNTGLGHFKDNPELLEKASKYLLNYEEIL